MDHGADLEGAESVVLNGVEGFGGEGRVRAAVQEGPIPLIAMTTVVAPGPAATFAELLLRLAGECLVTVAEIALLDAAAGPLHALGDEFAQLVVHCRIGAGRDDPAGIGA
jgi:hypothetical protein